MRSCETKQRQRRYRLATAFPLTMGGWLVMASFSTSAQTTDASSAGPASNLVTQPAGSVPETTTASTNSPTTSPPQASAETPEQQARTYFDNTVKPLLESKDNAKIEDALKECLVLDPHFVPALYRLGLLAQAGESWNDAIIYFQMAKGAKAQPAQLSIINARLAEVAEMKQIDSVPGGKEERHYDGHVLAAQLLLNRRLYQDALKEANAAIAINPRRWEAYISAAAAGKELHNHDLVVEMLQNALKTEPLAKKPATQKLLKLALAEQKKNAKIGQLTSLIKQAQSKEATDRDGAAKLYCQAFSMAPTRGDIALRAASLYILAKKYEKASSILLIAQKTVQEPDLTAIRSLRAKIDTLQDLVKQQKQKVASPENSVAAQQKHHAIADKYLGTFVIGGGNYQGSYKIVSSAGSFTVSEDSEGNLHAHGTLKAEVDVGSSMNEHYEATITGARIGTVMDVKYLFITGSFHSWCKVASFQNSTVQVFPPISPDPGYCGLSDDGQFDLEYVKSR
jgi:tetratricopeptide (TPR) repeat protein